MLRIALLPAQTVSYRWNVMRQFCIVCPKHCSQYLKIERKNKCVELLSLLFDLKIEKAPKILQTKWENSQKFWQKIPKE
jgi:hypothetical protein